MVSERLRTLLHDGSVIAALFTLALLLTGCAGCSNVESGCRTDDDCRAGRICAEGVCQDPDFVLNNDQNSSNSGNDAGNNGADFNNFTPDANNLPGDMSRPDSGPFDQGNPDLSTPDLGDPDFSTPDSGDPDLSTPDLGDPDFSTPDSGDPDLSTPDFGTDAGSAQPQIRVTPATEIDFGRVLVGSSVSTPLLVENVGDGDLVITGLDLTARPSQGFDVAPVIDATSPVTISPGGSETYTVTFTPTVQGNYANGIDIASNDPVNPDYVVDLRGRGRDMTNNATCLSASPVALDFGTVDPGSTRTRTVTMTNCGPDQVTITDYSIVDDPTGPFSFSAATTPPLTLLSNETTTVDVTFAPQDLQAVSDFLRIRSDAQFGTQIDVELTGTGGGCATAVALAESQNDITDSPRAGRIPIVIGDSAVLDGSESSSPSGGALDYSWTITSQPQGSTASLSDPSAESPTLSPDVAGTYVIELEVIDLSTATVGCVTDSVEIVALDDIPDVRIDASWAADHDMDLHLLRSDTTGAFGDIGDMVDDVHYANLSPDWNVANVATDDPFHYGDDTDGFGPETIVLTELEAGRSYRVILQFARTEGTRPFSWDANVTLTIQSSTGVPMVHNMTRQFTRQELGLSWIIWDIDGSTGTVTTVDTTQN